MTYRAAIFDLDGTLLDTLEDLADSMNAVLRNMGYPEHAVEAYRYFVGDGMEMLARRTLPESAVSDEQIARTMAGMEEEYGRRWADKTRPYPGIPEMLDELERRRIPKAVLSNKPDPFTKLTVKELLAGWTFDPVLGIRPGVPKKPDPVGALEIAAHLQIAPGEFLYLGDTNTDMQTAHSAGMFALGATWGFRPGTELKASGARRLLDHPSELLALL